jgi:hypothetical protein
MLVVFLTPGFVATITGFTINCEYYLDPRIRVYRMSTLKRRLTLEFKSPTFYGLLYCCCQVKHYFLTLTDAYNSGSGYTRLLC